MLVFLGFSVSSAPRDADTAMHRVLEMYSRKRFVFLRDFPIRGKSLTQTDACLTNVRTLALPNALDGAVRCVLQGPSSRFFRFEHFRRKRSHGRLRRDSAYAGVTWPSASQTQHPCQCSQASAA